jgi:hypothetical protein
MAVAGSCTTTRRNLHNKKIYTWSFTTDASGDCTSVGSVADITGKVIGTEFVPTSVFTDAAIDISLVDTKGADMLFDALASVTTTATSNARYQTPLTADSKEPFWYLKDLKIVVNLTTGEVKTGDVLVFLE